MTRKISPSAMYWWVPNIVMRERVVGQEFDYCTRPLAVQVMCSTLLLHQAARGSFRSSHHAHAIAPLAA